VSNCDQTVNRFLSMMRRHRPCGESGPWGETWPAGPPDHPPARRSSISSTAASVLRRI